MAQYPGQPRRRWPLAIAAGAVIVLAAVGTTWVLAHRTSGAASGTGAFCPGGRDDSGRHKAAACLITSYFALENTSAAQRSARLSDLVLPSALDAARSSYKALDGKVAAEYAAVAATNLQSSATQRDTDVVGQAWVAFVDRYRDTSQVPLAQWWITSFQLRWQDGRWWLNGGVGIQVNATPPTATAAHRTGFGAGWVAAGGG